MSLSSQHKSVSQLSTITEKEPQDIENPPIPSPLTEDARSPGIKANHRQSLFSKWLAKFDLSAVTRQWLARPKPLPGPYGLGVFGPGLWSHPEHKNEPDVEKAEIHD